MSSRPSNKIDAGSHPLEAVFNDFYEVPDFQREYVWKRRHVNKLLDDLHTAFTSKEVDNYFLGSIVFFAQDDVYHLVDGQQRMATLFILVSAIRDRLRELNPTADLELYDRAVKSPSKARGVGVSYRYRVVLQFPEMSKILEAIGDGGVQNVMLPRGASPRKNLLNAYWLCEYFLREQFGEDADRLDSFFTFLWKDVELISILTEDMRTAFTIFETINERGVGLDAMDLLKNLLFQQVSDARTNEALAGTWRELLRVLRDGGETKPIRFLRYYLIATNDFDRVPTAKVVFDWITQKENKTRLGYGKAPAKFADQLLDGAIAYANFSQGLDIYGDEVPALAGINYQRTGVRQHLCLLLAARHLSASAFGHLCRSLERLVFVFAMTNAQWNELEKALPDWTKTLREAGSKADVEAFVEQCVLPEIDSRLDQFKARLEDTSLVANRLIRYLLAAVTQHLEEQCGKGGDFDRYFTEKLTIEHILPQSTTAATPGPAASAWIKAFAPDRDLPFYVNRLGNLTLLHRSPNSSARDAAFKPNKLNWYKKCPYDLTRAIAEDLSGGRSTKLTRTVKKYGLHPYESWHPADLQERHEIMLHLAEEYWGVPLS